MIDYFDRQIEAHIANLIIKLNNKGTLGTSTEIRLHQLQTNEWLHDNPLSIWNYNDVNVFKNNIIAQILCIMNTLGLSIDDIGIQKNTFRIEPQGYPIMDILKNEYRKHKTSLRNKNIMYIEQITYNNIQTFKNWDEISTSFNIAF